MNAAQIKFNQMFINEATVAIAEIEAAMARPKSHAAINAKRLIAIADWKQAKADAEARLAA